MVSFAGIEVEGYEHLGIHIIQSARRIHKLDACTTHINAVELYASDSEDDSSDESYCPSPQDDVTSYISDGTSNSDNTDTDGTDEISEPESW